MAHPYDRTVAELMVEAAARLDYPTSRGEVVQWFAEHYPQVKTSTIRAYIVGLTANDPSRHHYPSLARREALFTRHLDGSLGAFDGLDEDGRDGADPVDVAAIPPLEFALEAFGEEFTLTNWEGIDWGRPLELWESETEELGHQLATPVGRLDFLCRDKATDALVKFDYGAAAVGAGAVAIIVLITAGGLAVRRRSNHSSASRQRTERAGDFGCPDRGPGALGAVAGSVQPLTEEIAYVYA